MAICYATFSNCERNHFYLAIPPLKNRIPSIHDVTLTLHTKILINTIKKSAIKEKESKREAKEKRTFIQKCSIQAWRAWGGLFLGLRTRESKHLTKDLWIEEPFLRERKKRTRRLLKRRRRWPKEPSSLLSFRSSHASPSLFPNIYPSPLFPSFCWWFCFCNICKRISLSLFLLSVHLCILLLLSALHL